MSTFGWIMVLCLLFGLGWINMAISLAGAALILFCIAATLTAPIWITYYIAKAVHEWTNTKR